MFKDLSSTSCPVNHFKLKIYWSFKNHIHTRLQSILYEYDHVLMS